MALACSNGRCQKQLRLIAFLVTSLAIFVQRTHRVSAFVVPERRRAGAGSWFASSNSNRGVADVDTTNVPNVPTVPTSRATTETNGRGDGHDENIRRRILRLSSSSLSLLLLPPPSAAVASDADAADDDDDASAPRPFLDCLLDLPPVDPDCVRVYLCRHGQTELNRLGLVQGARVDPPLNDTGRRMARRIGEAVGRLKQRYDDDGPNGSTVFLWRHSGMARARETASLGLSASSSSDVLAPRTGLDEPLALRSLPSTREVDFGAGSEGKRGKLVKAKMASVFAAWATGRVDERGDGGGESGREVYERAALSLRALSRTGTDDSLRATTKTTTSVVAVSHSTFLRVLLSLAMDVPLSRTVAPLLEQKNGCVNVLDVNARGRTTTRRVAPTLSVDIPAVRVLRVNEVRHLSGLLAP